MGGGGRGGGRLDAHGGRDEAKLERPRGLGGGVRGVIVTRVIRARSDPDLLALAPPRISHV